MTGLCPSGLFKRGWKNTSDKRCICNDTTNKGPEWDSNQIVISSLYGVIAALFLSMLLNIFLIARNARRAFYKRQSLNVGNKEENSAKESYVTAPVRIEERTNSQEPVQLINPSINDTEESNAGYLELGQLSQPSHYEELERYQVKVLPSVCCFGLSKFHSPN
ncbi:uncharacterized protein LOC134253144 [Saccostrea cucullata]|uniref:uncharacterized protein LOC134253144 n=1 Tax=Saccostrea cuccullata TaxID=36930 RepID=UPI002ED08BF3